MMAFLQKDRYGIEDLLAVMKLLREKCPWDREQTHQSIRKNFIEETCEAVEAIDLRDADLLREELGDVLLQVVFHSRIEEESGGFGFQDVCDGICKKLVYRHPHIFAETRADTADQVLKNWDALKKEEKHQTTVTQTLRAVPRTFPATMRCEKVQKRAARSGFDYTDAAWAMRDLKSEVEELSEAIGSGDQAAIKEELGDLIFSAVNVSRFVKVDAEEALGESCDKFIARFEQVEGLAEKRGIDMYGAGVHVLDELWREVKTQNKKKLEVLEHDKG
jgi:tetrapyrrole methylase family protein/MazG family protein